MKKTITWILAALLICSCFSGCDLTGPVPTTTAGSEQLQATTAAPTTEAATTPSPTTEAVPEATTEAVTTPAATTAAETTPAATTAAETTPAPTTVPETTPPPTEPRKTEPPATTPKPTDPPATPPPHQHSYQMSYTKEPTCDKAGYTEYECSCGKSYKDNEVAALGHKMVETERKDATTAEEGYIKYTCEHCGATSTESIPKVTEVIDIAALEEYGKQYAVGQGYRLVPGLRDGYYPGLDFPIASMEEGKRHVRGCIDATTSQLEACGLEISWTNEDGTTGHTRFDIKIEDLGNGWYLIWVYYG